MSLFERIAGKLFSQGKKVGIQEILKRDQQFRNNYQDWIQSRDFQEFRIELLRSWESPQNVQPSGLNLAVYSTDYANGFILFPQSQGADIPLSFVMEYLKDRILTLSYRMAHRERSMEERENTIQTLEKYYLKPEISGTLPVDQKYGNILIELVKDNAREHQLKFLVTMYSGRHYSKPLSMHELMHFLFDK